MMQATKCHFLSLHDLRSWVRGATFLGLIGPAAHTYDVSVQVRHVRFFVLPVLNAGMVFSTAYRLRSVKTPSPKYHSPYVVSSMDVSGHEWRKGL